MKDFVGVAVEEKEEPEVQPSSGCIKENLIVY